MYGRVYEEDFIVVEGTPTSLLGVKAYLAMELLHFRKENVASVNRMDFGALTKDQILQKFEHLFDSNLGCFVDKPVHHWTNRCHLSKCHCDGIQSH